MKKVDTIMSEIESQYFPVGEANGNGSEASHQQHVGSKELVALLWKMVVLVETRATASELCLFLKTCKQFGEGTDEDELSIVE